MRLRICLFLGAALLSSAQTAAPSVDERLAAQKLQEQRRMERTLNDFLDPDPEIKESAVVELFREGLWRALYAQRTIQLQLAKKVERLAEARRVDKQVAGEAGNSGTTSLIALSGAPQLLSAALESGVLSQTSDASVATFRLNAAALAKLFHPETSCYLLADTCNPTLAQRLKGLSLAASFDQAKPEGGAVSGTAEASGGNGATGPPATAFLAALRRSREIRSVSLKYELRRRRSLMDSTTAAIWRKKMEEVRPAAGKVAKSANAIVAMSEVEASRQSEATKKAVENLDAVAGDSNLTHGEKLKKLQAVVEMERQKMLDAASPETVDRVVNLYENLAEFRAQRNEILHDVLYPAGVSLEYIFQKPAMQAEYSQIRLSVTKPFGATPEEAATGANPNGQFTANLGGSFYHSPAAGLGSFRDFRGGMQLDRKIAWKYSEARPVFSLAAYGQYQAEKGILEFDQNEVTPIGGIPIPKPAKLLLDTKGTIVIAQAKLVIPLGDKGVTFPIAISWANRTEFIKAKEVKWQFGFTFDLDKVVSQVGSK
jgi:hypothetical protein